MPTWSTAAWAALGEWAGAIATIAVAYLVYRWGKRERDHEAQSRRSGAVLAWPTEEGIAVTNVGPDPVVAWSVSTCKERDCSHSHGRHEWTTIASNRTHGPMAVGRTAEVRMARPPTLNKPGVPDDVLVLHVAFRDANGVLWVREGEELHRADPPIPESLQRRLRRRLAARLEPST